jgi:serine/threonine-protein kinase HipA
MEREAFVYMDFPAGPALVGRLWSRIRKGRESANFEYEGARIPFLSAMSLLGAADDEPHSYLEIAEALRQTGAEPNHDLQQLWRRIVFNVLISNTDDHLCNHGFLYEGPRGWRLSPAYDMNPVPVDVKPRMLSTSIDPDDPSASIDLAMEPAAYFGLDHKKARTVAAEVAAVVSTWRKSAEKAGLGRTDMDRMASAFEHHDLQQALAYGRCPAGHAGRT